MTLWPEAADYLLGQSGPSLAALYWFFLVFEVPRYVILFALFALMPRRRAPTREFAGRRKLTEALMKLEEVEDDPKHSRHRRPSGEMSPAKKLKSEEKEAPSSSRAA